MYKNARNWILCGTLLLMGELCVSAAGFNTTFGPNSSWGNTGYVDDYYYGEKSTFQQDDNMFTYGGTATQNMGSTSSGLFGSTTIDLAADLIVPGSTLLGYSNEKTNTKGGGTGSGWAPPTTAPIGDGLWILLLLAIGYGVRVYVRSLRCKKLDRFAVRS